MNVNRHNTYLADRIYKLKLHENINFSSFSVTRVPGGWIYVYPRSVIFVPYNNEFLLI